MEDTHGEKEDGQKGFMVLILIIMEDTHGDLVEHYYKTLSKVLILIIMEDTHGESRHISP